MADISEPVEAKAGTVLMTVEPYVHVLAPEYRGKLCDFCLKENPKLRRCSQCHTLYYCNQQCQRSGWGQHKLECRCLQRTKRVLAQSARLLLHCIIRTNREGDEEVFQTSTDPGLKSFSTLMSHTSTIPGDEKRLREFTDMCYTLKAFAGNDITLPNPHTIIDMFSKMRTNTFTICDEQHKAIGSGIYLSASVLDHSCVPNVAVTYRGSTMDVRAIQDLPSSGWAQLRLGYVDLLQPAADRQNQLQDQYNFTCTCPRCLDDHESAVMRSVNCPASGCSGVVPRDQDGQFLKCELCGLSTFPADLQDKVDQTETQLVTVKKKAEDMVKSPQKNIDGLKAAEELGNEAMKLTSTLSPLHVTLVTTLDLVCDVCVNNGCWDLAMYTTCHVLTAYRRYLPQYHPLSSQQLLRAGKLLLLLNLDMPRAQQLLIQARDNLAVSHGTAHALYREAGELQVQCVEMLRHETIDTDRRALEN